MTRHVKADICIIGAGSGGLSVAAGAAQLGAKTVLFERAEMGGDCLNVGCVPSKSLIASARAAYGVETANGYGADAELKDVDYRSAMTRVTEVIESIAPHDSQARFEGLGVEVIRSEARFTGPNEVTADDVVVTARAFVIATGSKPAVPPITGLDAVPYFTNETLFANREKPEHLIVLGGGAIGIEMAQTHRRLGSEVTLVEMATILPREDPELVAPLREKLKGEGIEIIEGARVDRVAEVENGIEATITGDNPTTITASHLLVAAGRTPQTANLDLDKAGIAATPKGITVDARLRTTNKRVYAIGDVAGGPQFTHAAGYHAGIIIRNALFRMPAKVDYRALPWVTFSDPELARIGLTEAEAREKHGDTVKALRVPFADIDRARTDGKTDGLIKVVVTGKGEILGASILGDHAGEHIHLWTLAMSQKLGLKAIASMIAPYPTMGEISKRAAGSFYAEKLFSAWPRRIVKFLGRFG
ncbi:dihydrolipoyl dehydrogenase family protein [Bauldia sp.]|uniref:dihydrolipoyl dehydrogenase family protein n=1 Tax=Bauldia sp. TaxID=2575872 RepID=UPI003BAB0D39